MRLEIIAVLAQAVLGGLNPIIIKGSKFFDSVTKEQFFIKGASYQPRKILKVDPLAVPLYCKRDAPYFKDLGINTIRVFETYPNHNHTECMKIFEEHGIYVLIDLPIPEFSINRELPVYHPEIHEHYKQKIEAFYKFNNTLGFIAGNEIANEPKVSGSAVYAKAALRDAKVFMNTKPRYIPIGYADNDDPRIRKYNQDYFTCGLPFEQADFYAVNTYRWCGESNFKQSRYNELIDELKYVHVPTFLSEYGCNTPKVRTFTEVSEIYGDNMGKILSGGLVYEYSNETNAFGLVTIDEGKVIPHEDYKNLKEKLTSVKIEGIKFDTYQPHNQLSACPITNDHYKSNSVLPPSPNKDACECIYNSLECRALPQAKDPFYKQKIQEKIAYLCDNITDCADIQSDGQNARYGKFSMCPDYIKYSIVFNSAYQCKENCNFDDLASLVPVSSHSPNETQCLSLPSNIQSTPSAFQPLFSDVTIEEIKKSESYTYSKSPGETTSKPDEEKEKENSSSNQETSDSNAGKKNDSFGLRTISSGLTLTLLLALSTVIVL